MLLRCSQACIGEVQCLSIVECLLHYILPATQLVVRNGILNMAFLYRKGVRFGILCKLVISSFRARLVEGRLKRDGPVRSEFGKCSIPAMYSTHVSFHQTNGGRQREQLPRI